MVDAVAAARAFVEGRYAGARAAFLGGSAATGRATQTSDLDVDVLETAGGYLQDGFLRGDRPIP